MKVINLFGAPGSGKSTTMLGLTYQMKMLGLSVENTPEYFKDLILEGTDKGEFGGQLAVLAEQNRRLARLVGKNDFAVTDCPLPLIDFYTPKDYVDYFHEFSKSLYNKYDNAANYFIVRAHTFENEKRVHDEATSDKLSKEIYDFLNENNIKVKVFESSEDLVTVILADLIKNQVVSKENLQKARNPSMVKKFYP